MEVPSLKKARALGYFIGEIARNINHDDHVVKANVEAFNAISLPNSYVCVVDGLVHVVNIVSNANDRPRLSATVAYKADVIWLFYYMTGIWYLDKDRTGLFAPLCPIKCGGSKVLSVPVQ